MNSRTLVIILIHVAVLIAAYLLLYRITPLNTSMLLWDARWYNEIRLHGYVYVPNAMCNLAFFPLFPVVWKISQLDMLGICVLNIILFIGAFTMLMGKTKYPVIYLLVLTSFPSFIFFFAPYSEALFFISGTLLITGYQTNNRWLIVTGLLLCGTTRAVSTIFIPAVILTELLYFRKITRDIWIYTSACLAAILGIAFIQALQTGKWFYFLGVQKYWNRHFQLPGLPFTTDNPELVLGVDVIGYFIGLIAAYFSVRWILSKTKIQVCRSVIFSCLYLAGVAFLDSFFTYDYEGHARLWSMNRHIIATPFFICFLNWFYLQYKQDKIDQFIIPGIILTGLLLTLLPVYPLHLLYYIVFFITMIITEKYRVYSLYALYVMQVFLLFTFYQAFLQEKWIG